MPKPLPAASKVNVYEVADQRQPTYPQKDESFGFGNRHVK
jgi:hypothetical protein